MRPDIDRSMRLEVARACVAKFEHQKKVRLDPEPTDYALARELRTNPEMAAALEARDIGPLWELCRDWLSKRPKFPNRRYGEGL